MPEPFPPAFAPPIPLPLHQPQLLPLFHTALPSSSPPRRPRVRPYPSPSRHILALPCACAAALAVRGTVAESAATTVKSVATVSAISASPPVAAAQYVPLHVHSDFSLLDGASRLPDLVARAAELGVPALALTDHGVLYGAVALVRECAKDGHRVKPIIGNEMYVVNVDTPYVAELAEEAVDGKKGKKKPAPKRYHLIVLAKNTAGYRSLVKLTTHAHLHGKVGPGMFARPCVDKALLYQHREGLIVSSGCLGGEVAQAILVGRVDVARKVAAWYRDAFGDDYYLEIQDHGSAEDRIVNVEVVKIGRELGIPVICTNDSHFTSCLDAEAHDALVCIQTGKVLTDEKRLKYSGKEFFKSVDEMRECFTDHLEAADIEAALATTLTVADKVEGYDLFGDTRIPDFPVPVCGSSEEEEVGAYVDGDHVSYLRHVARLGMGVRLENRLSSGLLASTNSRAEIKKVYADRLLFELDMIEQMGFASYFLVVWDYILYARNVGIPVGPGRGSAAGSLVAFALRITDVDPIQYNLLFERFLNPERKSMPDIDTDFSVAGREKIIEYVTDKYGGDRVAQIITFNRLTSKAVLKDVARVHEVPYSQADKLAKLIPVTRGKPATLTQMLAEDGPSPEFKQLVRKNPGWETWLSKAKRIEGTNKTFGIHAAGVVISAEPLSDTVPLSRAKHGETITQYPMEDVEAMGLLKMDFLGLKNLTVIETALGLINTKRQRLREKSRIDAGVADGVDTGLYPDLDFSVDALPLDDRATYELLSTGELVGIFQLDASAGMRSIVRELRPSSLEDISAILALYRPGPLDAGLIPKFINRKHGREAIKYDHELLEPILCDTYGVMVYQEQIMRIARDLAGYSLGQADILRRAMGKKKTEEMEREKPRFIKGAIERGVQESVATALFEQMILFAEYCFNKSHSTAYAYLTYQTAYLKANHPVEYSAALLRANSHQSDKLVRYLADANACGVRVVPPAINRSELGFSVDIVPSPSGGAEQSAILFGLEAIRTVGDSVGKALIEEREANGPFHSIIDVIERLDARVLNKRSMGALVLCGAFDELHPNRRVLREQLEVILALYRKVRDRRKRREKRTLTAEAEQKAIAKDLEDWEEVRLTLESDSRNSPDFPMLEKLAAEKETLGFYASGHPLLELGRDLGAALGSTPVPRIIGENSSAEPAAAGEDEIDGAALLVGGSGDRIVEDGAEVLCLSLVTDLKRMVTARGKNMAKWSMEDTGGRVSAVVFPTAYELCEVYQNVSPAKDASGKWVTPEPEKVVSEDARVLVWGKVDRESSGTAQVIVDDVQRVEEAVVVVATIPYEENVKRYESNAEQKGVSLRCHVRSWLSPGATGSAGDGGLRQFTNKDGETFTARVRVKKTKLVEKRRIPLIIRVLGPEGTPTSVTYAGHGCRFRDDAEIDRYGLTELKPGTSFVKVPVSDLIAEGGSSSIHGILSGASLVGTTSALVPTAAPAVAPVADESSGPIAAHVEAPAREMAAEEEFSIAALNAKGVPLTSDNLGGQEESSESFTLLPKAKPALERLDLSKKSPGPQTSALHEKLMAKRNLHSSRLSGLALLGKVNAPEVQEDYSAIAPSDARSMIKALSRDAFFSGPDKNLDDELVESKSEEDTDTASAQAPKMEVLLTDTKEVKPVLPEASNEVVLDVSHSAIEDLAIASYHAQAEIPVDTMKKRRPGRPVKSASALSCVNLDEEGFGGLLDGCCLVAAEAASIYSDGEVHLHAIGRLDLTYRELVSNVLDVTATVADVTFSGAEVVASDALVHVLLRVRENKAFGGRRLTRELATAVFSFRLLSSDDVVPVFKAGSARSSKDKALVEARLVESALAATNLVKKSGKGWSSKHSQLKEFKVPNDVLKGVANDGFGDGGNLLLWMTRAAEETGLEFADSSANSRVLCLSAVSFFQSLQSVFTDNEHLRLVASVEKCEGQVSTVLVLVFGKTSGADKTEAVAAASFMSLTHH